MKQEQKELKATYPLSTIAKVLMITDRRVQQLVHEGVIPKVERGRYELMPAIQGYIKYLKDRAIGADAIGTDNDHKNRLMKARADIAEFEVERLKGELVEVDKVQKTWEKIASTVRAKFLSIAPKAAPIVAVEETADECHAIIQKFINEALEELSTQEIDIEEIKDEHLSDGEDTSPNRIAQSDILDDECDVATTQDYSNRVG